MTDNIITAVFGAMRETKVRPRYRYDQGQVLVIRGVRNLPDFFEAHFANAGSSSDATIVIGTPDGVNIPNSMFESGATILCYIYVHDEATDGTTVYKVTIPIINRARPADVEPTPEEADVIAQAIVALNENVGRAEDAADQAEAAVSDVTALTERAEAAAAAAETAEGNVVDYATRAESAADGAAQAERNAGAEADRAEGAQAAAETAQDAAETAQEAAETARDRAENAASNAAQSAQDASDYDYQAAQARYAAVAAKEAAEAAQDAAETAQDAAETAQDAAESAQGAAESAQGAAEAARDRAETAASNASASAAEAARDAGNAAQTLTNVQAEGAAQIAAIDAEGQEVLESIPEDYTALEADVAELKSEVGELKTEIYNELGTSTVYDAIDDTHFTKHNGTPNMKYALNIVLPANLTAVISVKVYASCTFTIYLASASTKKIIGYEEFNLVAGKNTVKLSKTYPEDAYIGITGEPDSIYWNTTGDNTIKCVTSTSAWVIGTTISDPDSSNTRVGVALTLQTTKDINGRIDELSNDVDDLNSDIVGLTGGTYSSMPFEYNSSAGPISSFMLLQPAPNDGTITKVYFKEGATQGRIGLAVYEWSDKSSLDNIVKKEEYPSIIAVDGIADTAIRIKKGQYIGIYYNVSSTCAWYNGASGAGFVYLPTEQGAALYADKYITLAYTMTIDSVTDQLITSPLKNKTILLAGDSRSSTDYSFYWSTLSKKTGGIVLVEGASGKTAAYIAGNTYFNAITSNPHDFSIWLVGGNDAGRSGDVGTFSATSPNGLDGEPVVTETDITQNYDGTKFIQAIDHIIRKYRALYYDFKTINDGHKYRMIMCTDLPQNRDDATSDWSQPANWERKVNAIIEACQKNNIPYLDLYHNCAFDMSQEPYWTSPTDQFTDNGIYFMDGLHPNQYGIDIITSLEVEEMKKFVSINPYPEST